MENCTNTEIYRFLEGIKPFKNRRNRAVFLRVLAEPGIARSGVFKKSSSFTNIASYSSALSSKQTENTKQTQAEEPSTWHLTNLGIMVTLLVLSNQFRWTRMLLAHPEHRSIFQYMAVLCIIWGRLSFLRSILNTSNLHLNDVTSNLVYRATTGSHENLYSLLFSPCYRGVEQFQRRPVRPMLVNILAAHHVSYGTYYADNAVTVTLNNIESVHNFLINMSQHDSAMLRRHKLHTSYVHEVLKIFAQSSYCLLAMTATGGVYYYTNAKYQRCGTWTQCPHILVASTGCKMLRWLLVRGFSYKASEYLRIMDREAMYESICRPWQRRQFYRTCRHTDTLNELDRLMRNDIREKFQRVRRFMRAAAVHPDYGSLSRQLFDKYREDPRFAPGTAIAAVDAAAVSSV